MVVKIPHRATTSGGGFQPTTLDDASKAAAKSIVKFYGTSVPRPRFFSSADGGGRVDPPLPVLDPLLSWANEAHWSMGGLSFHRLRLQGRIEGSVEKLRVQREKVLKKSSPKGGNKRASSISPPPAPMAVKRRRFLAPSDDEDEFEDEDEDDEADGELKKAMEEEEGEEMEMDTPLKPKTSKKKSLRKGAVRKLGDDFERVANESNHVQIAGKAMSVVDEVNLGFESKPKEGLRNGQKRTSARLAKRSPN